MLWLLVTSSSLVAPPALRLAPQAPVSAVRQATPMMLMRDRVGLMEYTSPYVYDQSDYGLVPSYSRRGYDIEDDLEDDAFRHGRYGGVGPYRGGYGYSRRSRGYGGYGSYGYGGMGRYRGYSGYGYRGPTSMIKHTPYHPPAAITARDFSTTPYCLTTTVRFLKAGRYDDYGYSGRYGRGYYSDIGYGRSRYGDYDDIGAYGRYDDYGYGRGYGRSRYYGRYGGYGRGRYYDRYDDDDYF